MSGIRAQEAAHDAPTANNTRVEMEVREIASIAFTAVMAAALIWDLARRRIPNALVVAGLVLGAGIRFIVSDHSLITGLLGAGLALALTFPLFALRAMGGGDVKLFAVTGMFLGPTGFFAALLVSGLAGGAIGLFAALRQGVILPVLLSTRDLGLNALTLGRAGERPTLDSPGAMTIPYGAAIAIGSLAVWFVLGGGPQ
jgi:prepilin peptidase CpaA